MHLFVYLDIYFKSLPKPKRIQLYMLLRIWISMLDITVAL